MFAVAGEGFLALTLVIGSKTYSSWSLRPWLALAHHKIPFDEVLIPNGTADFISQQLRQTPLLQVLKTASPQAVFRRPTRLLQLRKEPFKVD